MNASKRFCLSIFPIVNTVFLAIIILCMSSSEFVCSLHSSPPTERVSPSMRGGRVAVVMWNWTAYPLHCAFSYFCAPPRCCSLSPGILSSCEGIFLCRCSNWWVGKGKNSRISYLAILLTSFSNFIVSNNYCQLFFL